jgi:hypothetical protein
VQVQVQVQVASQKWEWEQASPSPLPPSSDVELGEAHELQGEGEVPCPGLSQDPWGRSTLPQFQGWSPRTALAHKHPNQLSLESAKRQSEGCQGPGHPPLGHPRLSRQTSALLPTPGHHCLGRKTGQTQALRVCISAMRAKLPLAAPPLLLRDVCGCQMTLGPAEVRGGGGSALADDGRHYGMPTTTHRGAERACG